MTTSELWSLREVEGGGGVPLVVAEGGVPDGSPILFLHGIGRSFGDFEPQFRGALAQEFKLVAFDLRGHGNSGKPWEENAYIESRFWAEDIASVAHATGIKRPIVVGWSYGGIAALDYVKTYGDAEIAGLNLVGNASTLAHGRILSTGLTPIDGLLSLDINENYAAYKQIVPRLTAKRGSDEWLARWTAVGMGLPFYARRAMSKRPLDYRETLASIAAPIMLSFGEKEPTYSEDLHKVVEKAMPGSKLSIYQGCGHSPFWENPKRFEQELADFARTAFALVSERGEE